MVLFGDEIFDVSVELLEPLDRRRHLVLDLLLETVLLPCAREWRAKHLQIVVASGCYSLEDRLVFVVLGEFKAV